MNRSIELYGDGIGRVDLVEHMGSDLTIVNSARVSFAKYKEALDEKDERLINYLVEHMGTINDGKIRAHVLHQINSPNSVSI